MNRSQTMTRYHHSVGHKIRQHTGMQNRLPRGISGTLEHSARKALVDRSCVYVLEISLWQRREQLQKVRMRVVRMIRHRENTSVKSSRQLITLSLKTSRSGRRAHSSHRSEKRFRERLSAKGFLRLLPSKPLIKQSYSRNNNLLSEDKNLNRAFQIQLQHETTTNIRGLKGFLISILKQHDRLF